MDDMQTIILLDENNEEVVLTLIMAFDYEGQTYFAMTPDDDEAEELGVVFLQRTGTEEEPVYEPVMDEALEDALFETFDELLDE